MSDFMQLNDVVLIGRTMAEYQSIFALDNASKQSTFWMRHQFIETLTKSASFVMDRKESP